jgi:TAT (twin-arginine translocation) pathway signal sequence
MLTRRTFLKTVAAGALGALLPTDGKKPNVSGSLFRCLRTDHSAPSQAIPYDQWISWESPLFGHCTGVMASPPDSRGRIVVRHHSVLGGEARILAQWNVRLLSHGG